jgi:hypothetical protein
MTDDKTIHQEGLRRNMHRAAHNGKPPSKESDGDGDERCCAAFGYLRGLREHADAIELRFRDGNSTWFPYSWLGSLKYNPSDGLLMKFSGDLVYLVLVRGSNLDRPLADSSINLTTAGLQRHRVLWLKEMTDEEIRNVGENGPTIDSIEVGEFESHEALNKWLEETAPEFLR